MVKNLPANVGDGGDLVLKPGSGRSPGVGNGNPTPVLLPRKFHGQKSLADYNSRGRKSQTQLSTRVSAHTHTHTHTTLSVENNGLSGLERRGMWRVPN